MIEEVSLKTHLIVSDVHDEYSMNWCGKFAAAKPKLKDGLPIFVIIGDGRRVEVNSIDMEHIETVAKKMTRPTGRAAITSDSSRIYIKELDGKETLMGVMTHKHIKTYQQMFDKFARY